jgi:tellurite resistance protein TerC
MVVREKTVPGKGGKLRSLWEKLRSISSSKHPWRRVRQTLGLGLLPPVLRRVIVGFIGGTVLLLGVAMVVLPGPAIIVVPLGLIILATEFLWARRSVRKVRDLMKSARNMVGGR